MAITCPNGHVNDEGNRFCDQCGAPLSSVASPAAAAPASSPAAPPVAPIEHQVAPTSDGSIVCATCGQENLPGTAFCENCGAQLPLPAPVATPEPAAVEAAPAAPEATAGGVVCPNCAFQNEPGNAFCEQCGANLAGAAAPATVAGAPDVSVGTETVAAAPVVAEEAAEPLPAVVDSTVAPPVEAEEAAAPPVETPGAQSQPATAEAQPPVDDTAAEPVAEAQPEVAAIPDAAPSATVDAPEIAPPTPQIAVDVPSTPAEATAGSTCANCGAALPPNAKFCMECGTKVEQPQPPQMVRPTHCQTCGAELPANAKFCFECGTKVELVPADTVSAPAQAVAPTYQEQAAAVEAPAQTAPEAAPVAAPSVEAPIESPVVADTAAPADASVSVPEAVAPPVAPVAPVEAAPPVAAAGPRLIGPNGASISLPPKAELVIGREDPISGIHPDIDMTPHGGEAGGVSRRHAILRQQGGQWTVTDLDSTNYTRVDGNRIAPNTEVPVHDGARLQFGRIEFQFLAQ